MIKNLYTLLLNLFIPKIETINVVLPVVKIELDRDFHNWHFTKHAEERMKDRKVSLTQIDMALKFGKENEKGVELRITDLPEKEFVGLKLPELKALTYLLPLTIILNKETKTIITLYHSNKTYLKDKIIGDARCSSVNNKYTRKMKGKLRDADKLKHHKERKYKKFYLKGED